MQAAQIHDFIVLGRQLTAQPSRITTRFEIAFWNKVFYPAAVLVMMMLALPFAHFQRRQGGIGFRIFAGTMLGLSYGAFIVAGTVTNQGRIAATGTGGASTRGAVSERFSLVYGPAPEEEPEIALTTDEPDGVRESKARSTARTRRPGAPTPGPASVMASRISPRPL